MRMLEVAAAVIACSIGSAAQSVAPPETGPRFDVASIRRNVSGEAGGEMRLEPSGQVSIRNYTLLDIVRNAYGVQPFQILPEDRVPDWFTRDRWDIIAKPPDGVQDQQRPAMLQNLLADRFRMVIKRETREIPVYVLMLARPGGGAGPQLRPSNGDCVALRAARAAGSPAASLPNPSRGFCGTRAGNGSVATSGVPLADFARNLAPMTGRFVIDRTGLSGPYDLDLKWTPDQSPVPPAAGALTDGTSLFAAVQEQLGLKLEPQRAPVDVVVIESVERPVVD